MNKHLQAQNEADLAKRVKSLFDNFTPHEILSAIAAESHRRASGIFAEGYRNLALGLERLAAALWPGK